MAASHWNVCVCVCVYVCVCVLLWLLCYVCFGNEGLAFSFVSSIDCYTSLQGVYTRAINEMQFKDAQFDFATAHLTWVRFIVEDKGKRMLDE